MKTCPSCGQPIADGAKFCGSCGQAVPNETPASFCPNCGEKLPAGANACPNCGTAQPAAVKPSKMPAMNNRKIGILAVAIVAVLLVALAIKVIPGMFTSPAKQFVSYQQELLTDRILAEFEESLNFYGTGKFSTDMTVTANVNNSEINRYLEDSSVALNLDLNSNTLLANGEVVLMGSPVLSGAITYDKGKVGFCLPEVDENYYVMDASQVLSDLSGTDMDLSGLKLPQISGKDWRSLIQSYLDLVYTVVNKENVEVEKNASFRLPQLGESCKGTIYTFAPRAEDVEAMLIKLAEALEKDETLRKLVLDLIDPDMLTAAFGDDIFQGMDPESELDNTLLDAADELKSNAAYFGEMVEDSGFTWELCVEGKEVRMIRLKTRGSDSMVAYEAIGKESEERTELFYVTSYDDITSLEHTYTKKGDAWAGEVVVTTPYDGNMTMEYDLDKSKKSVLGVPYGTYEFSADDFSMRMSMEVGKGENGGVDHVFSIRGDESDFDYMFERLELTVNTTDTSSAKKPTGTTVDISDYSEEEFYDLFSDLGETLQGDLISNLGPMLYGW